MYFIDELWGGVEKDNVPFITAKNNVSNKKNNIKRVKDNPGLKLDEIMKCCDFVIEGNGDKAYREENLDSVGIEYLKLEHLNDYWRKEKYPYEIIIEVVLELIKITDIDSDLKILNKKQISLYLLSSLG